MSRLFRPLREHNPFWLGLIATAVAVVLVLGAIAFGTLGLGKSAYQVELAWAGGLRPGDEVRIAGMNVGEVRNTGLEGDHVLLNLRLSRDVSLGAGTSASVKLATLLGTRYLELRPQGGGTLPGNRIRLAHTSVPYDLQTVLQTGTPLAEQLDSRKLRDALVAVGTNLRGDGPKIGAALDGLSRLSGVVTSRKDQIGHLIQSLDTVSGMVDKRSDQIFALMGQSDTLLTALLQRRELIRGVLTDLTSFTDQLRGTLAENQDRIGPLLDNAEQLTEVLRHNDEQVDRALQLVAPSGRYLNNLVGNGPYLDLYLPYSIIPDNVLCRAGAASGCH